MAEMCHCGKPLHYLTPNIQVMVENMIAQNGPNVTVTVGNRSWLVPRHYIALHGLRAVEVPTLGFQEIHSKPVI